MTSKSQLRAHLRKLRKDLADEQKIMEQASSIELLENLIHHSSGPFAAYWPLGSEFDVRPVLRKLWNTQNRVWLPRCEQDYRLSWHQITHEDQLITGSHGIREPDPTLVPAQTLDQNTVVIVPGVGFDAKGQRLGQGAGYYDRAIEYQPDLNWIGIGYSCQLVDRIPSDSHDQILDGLIIGGEWIKLLN